MSRHLLDSDTDSDQDEVTPRNQQQDQGGSKSFLILNNQVFSPAFILLLTQTILQVVKAARRREKRKTLTEMVREPKKAQNENERRSRQCGIHVQKESREEQNAEYVLKC